MMLVMFAPDCPEIKRAGKTCLLEKGENGRCIADVETGPNITERSSS